LLVNYYAYSLLTGVKSIPKHGAPTASNTFSRSLVRQLQIVLICSLNETVRLNLTLIDSLHWLGNTQHR